jgi:plasmid maintenance system antidote protein VapI
MERRSMTGDRNPNARLTPGDVLDIRYWATQGMTQEKIAQEFGITQAHVSDIVRRRKWAHLKEEV